MPTDNQTIMKIAIKIQENLFETAYHAAQNNDKLASEVAMTLRAYLNMGLNQSIYQVQSLRQLQTNLKAACHIAFSNEYDNGKDAPDYAQEISQRAQKIINKAYQNNIVTVFNN